MTDIKKFRDTMDKLVDVIKSSRLSNNDLIGCLETIKLDLMLNRRLVLLDYTFGKDESMRRK